MKRLRIIVSVALIAVLIPASVFAAISLDTTAASASQNCNLSCTQNITIAGANEVVLVGVQQLTSTTALSSVTLGGVTGTLVKSQTNGSAAKSEVYKIINPVTGAQTISVTYGGLINNVVITAAAYIGANTTIDASNSATANSTAPSVSLTTVAANAWTFDSMIFTVSGFGNCAVANGQTSIQILTNAAGNQTASAYKGPIVSPGAQTDGYTCGTVSGAWTIVAVSVAPSAAAIGNPVVRIKGGTTIIKGGTVVIK